MASHAYLRFMLKTPEGYLTPTGTTQDINGKDIIVMNIFEVGGLFSSKENQITKFFEKTTANLKFSLDEYQVVYYSCPLDRYYSCRECHCVKECDFWNNREVCAIN